MLLTHFSKNFNFVFAKLQPRAMMEACNVWNLLGLSRLTI